MALGSAFVDIDLHGYTADQAAVKLDSVLRKVNVNSTYQIRVIHGYHGGTAIRDMVLRRYRNHPKVRRIIPGENPGITVLVIKELY